MKGLGSIERVKLQFLSSKKYPITQVVSDVRFKVSTLKYIIEKVKKYKENEVNKVYISNKTDRLARYRNAKFD